MPPMMMGCGMQPPMMINSCFAPMPMPVAPMVPVAPMMPMNNSMAAGWCVGTLMGMPGVLPAIGKGLEWGYNNIIKPVWNGVVKPAWNFVKNDILKPIGSGLKWLWDHSIGWGLKKIGELTSKKQGDEDEDEEIDEVDETTENTKVQDNESVDEVDDTDDIEGRDEDDDE